jgi:hypothetical protein
MRMEKGMMGNWPQIVGRWPHQLKMWLWRWLGNNPKAAIFFSNEFPPFFVQSFFCGKLNLAMMNGGTQNNIIGNWWGGEWPWALVEGRGKVGLVHKKVVSWIQGQFVKNQTNPK